MKPKNKKAKKVNQFKYNWDLTDLLVGFGCGLMFSQHWKVGLCLALVIVICGFIEVITRKAMEVKSVKLEKGK